MDTKVVVAIAVGGIMLVFGGFIAGMLSGTVDISFPNSSDEEEVPCPNWETGHFWTYAFRTPDINPTVATTVVATKNETQYQLGIDDRLDAQRHAVLNYNPMLGRVTVDNLAVFEKGIPQNIFLFPMEKGKTWAFSFLDRERWDAKVVSISEATIFGKDARIVHIEASGPGGDTLLYSYDTSAMWLRSFVMKDASGNEEVSINLIDHGTGYRGDVFFVRGLDLYDEEHASSAGSPSIEIYDSFIDRGHPSWGPFDSLIYYYEVRTGSQSNGLMTIRDHSTTTVLRKTYDPGTSENGLGSVPSTGGEMGVTVVLQGTCTLRLVISGGIEYSWTV